MPGSKKKSMEELEKEVVDLIAESGQCKQDILMDSNKYRALKWRINDPGNLQQSGLTEDDGSSFNLSSV